MLNQILTTNMRKLLLSALLVSTVLGAMAQQNKDKKKATKTKAAKTAKAAVKGTWQKGGMLNVAITQGGTRNWAPGGDRFTLAANGFFKAYANNTKGRNHWDNKVEANYGLQNTNKYGIVKNDDRFELFTKWSHEIGKGDKRKWSYGVLGNLRTQLFDGYDFDGVNKKRISSFFAPAIGVIAPGMTYNSGNFNVHMSPIAARWVIVANRPYELAANYGVKPNREVKIEAGIFTSMNYSREVCKNITYTTRLDLFSDFVVGNPGAIDVFWNNMFYMKINKHFSAIYNFDLQYDDDTRIFGYGKNKAATQLKSVFGAGLAVKF